MSGFFQTSTAPVDPAYEVVRDSEGRADVREYIEAVWRDYQPFCPDADFLTQARQDFIAAAWQMHLWAVLSKRGNDLQKTKPKGPDICFVKDGVRHWAEAVAATAGTGVDAVPQPQSGVVYSVPHGKIILRLASAISYKLRQYRGWLEDGVVQADEPFIIAVNAGKVYNADLSPGVSFIEQAVLPIGNEVWQIEIGTSKVVDTRHEYRDRIAKVSGAEVSTDIFLKPEFGAVSAVLYSPQHISNHYKSGGADFITVHNPNARAKLQHGLFPFGVEKWVENDELHGKNWNDAAKLQR